jgi:hypothetical protein
MIPELPVFCDYINAANSRVDPSTVHVKNTGLNRFFVRYLLQRAMSPLEFRIPDAWDRNYFLYVLYCLGWIGVLNTDKFGVICQHCGLQGYNVYYHPTKIVVSNPLLVGIKELEIGREAALIQLQPDYGSIMDLVQFYANMMALTAETAGVNIFNSKLSYYFRAGNKAAAESYKKMFDQIGSGEPAVFVDKNLLNEDGSPTWDTFTQDLRSNYIAGDLLDDMRKWEERFDTEIGIPNANTNKRERLITDEVNANNFETRSRIELWLDTLRRGMKTANELFGLDLSVDWRPELRQQFETEGGAADESDTVDSGAAQRD